jgi:hypothetical protein
MMGENVKSLGSRLQTLWCKSVHPAPMWPVKGYYQCPVCLRSYAVPWEQSTAATRADKPALLTEAPLKASSHSAAVAAAASN